MYASFTAACSWRVEERSMDSRRGEDTEEKCQILQEGVFSSGDPGSHEYQVNLLII